MPKNLFLLIVNTIIVLFVFSCKGPDSEPAVIISGEIENYPEGTIILEEFAPFRIIQHKTVQTCSQGNFVIELDTLSPNFFRLLIDENNAIHLFLKPGDKIQIRATYPVVPRTYTVTGSDDSALLEHMNRELIKSTDKLNELQNIYTETIRNPLISLDSLRNEIIAETEVLYFRDRTFLTELIKNNPSSPVIYAALYQYILTNPILTIEKDTETFELALKSLLKHNPDLDQTALLESEINKFKLRQEQLNRDRARLHIGNTAPDFVLSSPEGESVSLSSFRGKYVLIHFWASWSRPSRNDNEFLLQLRKNTDPKELEIIQVSLDTDKTAWLNAIEADNTEDFVHISDFRMWESPVTKVYGLSSIPVNFLIDPKGEIIMINILPEELSNTVQGLIKK